MTDSVWVRMWGLPRTIPWLDCVYKLVEYDGNPTMKLSEDKETLVGAGSRCSDALNTDGMYAGDVIGCADESCAGASGCRCCWR